MVGGGEGEEETNLSKSLFADLRISLHINLLSYIHMSKQWQVKIISVISILCRSVQISSVYTVV